MNRIGSGGVGEQVGLVGVDGGCLGLGWRVEKIGPQDPAWDTQRRLGDNRQLCRKGQIVFEPVAHRRLATPDDTAEGRLPARSAYRLSQRRFKMRFQAHMMLANGKLLGGQLINDYGLLTARR